MTPERHEKVWGYEEWIANTPQYCGKRLFLRKGMRCSLHFHKVKDETFFVQDGLVGMEVGTEKMVLRPGGAVHVPPGVAHRFAGLSEAILLEFSTHHDEADSYRLEASGPLAMVDTNALIKSALDRFGPSIGIETSFGESLARELEGKYFACALEIGTMHGLSAALIALHTDRVVTVDIADRPMADDLLAFLGQQSKVSRVVVKDNDEKARVVNALDFDFAFLDGDHTRYGLIFDFYLTRRCGQVLLHDYPVAAQSIDKSEEYHPNLYPAAGTWLDGSGFLLDCIVPAGRIERRPPFAWWFAEQGNAD